MFGGPTFEASDRRAWLRTSGVNTIGASAKVVIFDRLGKKVRVSTYNVIHYNITHHHILLYYNMTYHTII